MYILEKLECELFKSKLKYYLFKGWSRVILLFVLIASVIFVIICIKYCRRVEIILPSTLGILAILISYGVYLWQLQLKIDNYLKEIKYLQIQTSLEDLFYLLLKFYFIHSYLNYILTPTVLGTANYKMTLSEINNINYFQKFKKSVETWQQFYERNFKNYDANLIQKFPEFLDLLSKQHENKNYILNIYPTVQKFFIDMEICIYTGELIVFNKMKDRLDALDFVWIKTLQILKFNIFEDEITKLTHNILANKPKIFLKYRQQIDKIEQGYLEILWSTNQALDLFYSDLIDVKLFDNEVSSKPVWLNIKNGLLKKHKEIQIICKELLSYSESEIGGTTHAPLVNLEKEQKNKT